VGIELHLRLNLAGLAVRGLHHRRVRPAHRGRVSRTAQIDFVLNAQEQALCERQAEAGIQPFAESCDGNCYNALAETINGLCKTE
jgi:hypothetical protein